MKLGFTLNETKELEKISFPTAAFKKDRNMFSTEFRKVLVFDSGPNIFL